MERILRDLKLLNCKVQNQYVMFSQAKTLNKCNIRSLCDILWKVNRKKWRYNNVNRRFPQNTLNLFCMSSSYWIYWNALLSPLHQLFNLITWRWSRTIETRNGKTVVDMFDRFWRFVVSLKKIIIRNYVTSACISVKVNRKNNAYVCVSTRFYRAIG